jgi:hypothetical protein
MDAGLIFAVREDGMNKRMTVRRKTARWNETTLFED